MTDAPERWGWEDDFGWEDSPDAVYAAPTIEIAADIQSPLYRRRRIAGWGAVVVAFVAGFASSEGQIASRLIKERGCPSVAPAAIKAARTILERPENPQIAAIYKKYRPPNKLVLQSAPGYKAIADKAAELDNFTLIDNTQAYIEQMIKAPILLEQLQVINSFTKHYGFKVRVNTSTKPEKDVVPFDMQELTDYDFAEGFINLINTLRFMPVEVIKATGLKKLEIVKAFSDRRGDINNVAAEAVGGSLMRISLSSLISHDSEDTPHELGHLFDYNFCGPYGFEHYDPQYESLNPDDFEYGVDGYWQDVTASEYGSSNIREDKAEVFEVELGGVNIIEAQTAPKTVQRKMALLLARLNKKVPGLADYLDRVSYR